MARLRPACVSQERLSGIARKLNQLSQEKLNVAVFSDLQVRACAAAADKAPA